jgi:hypothetical protein
MASLYSLMKKRRIVVPVSLHAGMSTGEYNWHINRLVAKAAPPDCILVSVQSVVNDLHLPSPGDDLPGAPAQKTQDAILGAVACMPPFCSMWLEYVLGPRCAIQIERIDDPAAPLVRSALWLDVDGSIALGLMMDLMLDADGACSSIRDTPVARLSSRRVSPLPLATSPAATSIFLAVALQSLSRMNCKNVELRPILEPKSVLRTSPKIVPASVWHEIKITSVPKIRTTGTAGQADDHRDVRSHWIRGHYADYRKGAGLFGNPRLKALFWIPEYKKGDESLGQVIPEYKIQ